MPAATSFRPIPPDPPALSHSSESGHWFYFGAAVFAACAAVRILLVGLACWKARISLDQYALLHDGWEYLRMAQAFGRFAPRALPLENLRLFPGYPAAIAILGAGRALAGPALGISILCAGLSAIFTSRLGRSRDLAFWMIALTPSWLLYSSVAMSEGLSTALALGALGLIGQKKWAWAGLLAGLGVVVRPVGAFMFIPLAFESWRAGGWRKMARAVLPAAAWPVLYLGLSRYFWGDALRSAKDYAETTGVVRPLESLWTHTLSPGVPALQKVLVWGMLGISALGAIGLWKQWRQAAAGPAMAEQPDSSNAPDFSRISLLRAIFFWHVSAGLFYLFTPGGWVFGSLDRYLSALWPGDLIGLAPWMARRRKAWLVLCAILSILSFLVALRWLINLSAVFPFEKRMLPP